MQKILIKRNSRIKGILNHIRAELREDLYPYFNVIGSNRGFYSVTIIIFSFIEYLGILWKNPVEYSKNGKKRKNYYTNSHIPDAAVPYIKKYLGRIREEYKQYAGVLYGLYRHPLVHQYHPGMIRARNNDIISWSIAINFHEDHLSLSKSVQPTSTGKLMSYKVININLKAFYIDLLNSIDELEKDALRFQSIGTNILRAYKKVKTPRPFDSLPEYIKKSFAYI